MLDALRDHHGELLAVVFTAMLVAGAWLEALFPRRPTAPLRARRWITNFAIAALNISIAALAAPIGAIAASVLAESHGWGAFRLLGVPLWLAIPLGILILDLSGYVSHRILHAVPILWRLHHVHHSDIDLDVTTTVRHHPGEAVFAVVLLFAAVLVSGIPPEAVVVHQIVATTLDFTSHSNVHVPARLDGRIRALLVTPDMHMVHHSAVRRETDSNYGTVFSWWDRLFGTYVSTPVAGLAGMTIGLDYRRAPSDQRLDRVLLAPFANPAPAGPLVPQASAATRD